jgi:hypothetical protein
MKIYSWYFTSCPFSLHRRIRKNSAKNCIGSHEHWHFIWEARIQSQKIPRAILIVHPVVTNEAVAIESCWYNHYTWCGRHSTSKKCSDCMCVYVSFYSRVALRFRLSKQNVVRIRAPPFALHVPPISSLMIFDKEYKL